MPMLILTNLFLKYMIPWPWPSYDLDLHMTLTFRWLTFRWPCSILVSDNLPFRRDEEYNEDLPGHIE